MINQRSSSLLTFMVMAFTHLMATDTTGDEQGKKELTFERDVRPIFKAMCFHCHGEGEIRKGGLDLRLVRLMQQGGESGEAIAPGDTSKSLLWERIESDDMPDGEKKLSPEEKQIIHDWITQGSQTVRPEPENVEDARYTKEELDHWSFATLRKVFIPSVLDEACTNPIDAFIGRKLNDAGLSPSPLEKKHLLIRRLSFDLRGLPPTPEEVGSFLNDTRENAWDRLVSTFLSSPHFGERWARHWLDTAGYAESDGGALNDPARPHAWRYRDYVMGSFNQNKPIDQFFQEQLAGDEMIKGEIDIFNSEHESLLAATGFLQMAPDATRTSNTKMDRNNAVAEMLKVVSSSMLGLTVGCAQCHDHKYDPVGIDDYYRFRSIFDPAFSLDQWRRHDARLIDLTQPDLAAEIDRIEAKAKKMEDDIKARREAVALDIQERKLADVPLEFQEVLRSAVRDPSKQRTEQQKKLLDDFPMVKPVSTIIGLLVEYDAPSYRKFEKEFEKVAAVRAKKPDRKMILATTEQPDVIPVSKVFFRGNPESPTQKVLPGELTALRLNGVDAVLPENDKNLPTTGRRLAYARHITRNTHPLTARVFVNRVWMHLLGRGIVATPGDFGLSGERPTHPGLLDWLAGDFVGHGWDLKRLVRQILSSHAYRQSSARREDLHRVDPENMLMGRANLKRLDAESVRDSLLVVAGLLNPQLGGASLPVTENQEGKTVIGVRKIKDGLKAGVDSGRGDANRRSLYIQMQRNKPLNMLATFDLPRMTPNCEIRPQTTVATQSLWFMNDSQMVDWSERMAESIDGDLDDATPWLEDLFVRLFASLPDKSDKKMCLRYLESQTLQFIDDKDPTWQDQLSKDPTLARKRALATLCQTLVASNRFLYID